MSASRKSEKKAAGRRNLAASVDVLSNSMAAASVQTTVGDIPRLISAMDRFASAHSTFESSNTGSTIRSEMAAETDINRAALVPLRHKVFTFEAALLWGFLLSIIVPHILSEDGGSLSAAFNLLRYHKKLETIYDLAVETNVWEYCEDSEDEDNAEEVDE